MNVEMAGAMTASKPKEYLRFDPRTKLLLLILMNVLIFISHSVVLECIVISFSAIMLSTSGKRNNAIIYIALFVVMLLVDRLVTPLFSASAVMTVVSFVTVAIRKVLPCIILGVWILSSTEIGEFIAAMRAIHLPQTVIIPISVAFRYFPTVREEWDSIRTAMRMRGIRFSMEHMMVPLLVSSVNIGSELSAAALCRGLDNPKTHTCYYEIGFHAADKAVLILVVALLLLTLIFRDVLP